MVKEIYAWLPGYHSPGRVVSRLVQANEGVGYCWVGVHLTGWGYRVQVLGVEGGRGVGFHDGRSATRGRSVIWQGSGTGV